MLVPIIHGDGCTLVFYSVLRVLNVALCEVLSSRLAGRRIQSILITSAPSI